MPHRSSSSRFAALLGRHEEVVATMLQRYDHRLAEFAQTLSDALNQTLPARITAAISGTPVDAPPPSKGRITRTSCASSSSRASRPPPTPPLRSSGRSRSRSSRRSASPRARSRRSAGSACPTTAARARSRSRSTATTRPRDGTRSGTVSPSRFSTRRTSRACSPCSREHRIVSSARSTSPRSRTSSASRARRSRPRSSCASRIPCPIAIRSPISTTAQHSTRSSTARSAELAVAASSWRSSSSTSIA